MDKESLKGIVKDEYLAISEKWVENNQTRQPENKNNINENNQENAPVYQQFVPPPQEREEFYPRSDF